MFSSSDIYFDSIYGFNISSSKHSIKVFASFVSHQIVYRVATDALILHIAGVIKPSVLTFMNIVMREKNFNYEIQNKLKSLRQLSLLLMNSSVMYSFDVLTSSRTVELSKTLFILFNRSNARLV